MKSTLPVLSLALLFASCTAAYKSGQTPDDVYFSPGRPASEYVSTDDRDDKQYRYNDDEYRDDRYLRMKVHNRRWSTLDDGWYSYNPYYYSYYNNYLYYNSPWSPYTYWNSYYNPYYNNFVIISPKTPVYNKPRTFNLNTYVPQGTTNSNPKTSRVFGNNNYNESGNTNNNYRNSGSNAGNFLRNVFSNSGSSSNNSGSTNSSNSAPSRSSSSGSSGGGGGSAPVRRF